MFDWLKTWVWSKPEPAPPKKPPPGKNRVWVGKKVFPLLAIDRHGFVAGEFDGNLTAGQRAHIEIHVNDLYGQFRFSPVVTITRTRGALFSGAWLILLPEIQQKLLDYTRVRQKALQRKP